MFSVLVASALILIPSLAQAENLLELDSKGQVDYSKIKVYPWPQSLTKDIKKEDIIKVEDDMLLIYEEPLIVAQGCAFHFAIKPGVLQEKMRYTMSFDARIRKQKKSKSKVKKRVISMTHDGNEGGSVSAEEIGIGKWTTVSHSFACQGDMANSKGPMMGFCMEGPLDAIIEIKDVSLR